MGIASALPGLPYLSQKKWEENLRELAELIVYGLNEKWTNKDTKETAFDLMRILHRNILHYDSMWHFFWEGSYTAIRCDPQYLPVVRQLIEANDKDLRCVEEKPSYQENIKITEKYLEAFLSIFHGYSLLAIEMDDEDFMQVLERNNHCFLNMISRESIIKQFTIPGDKCDTHTCMGWEAIALNGVAHMRAWTAGWYNAQ